MADGYPIDGYVVPGEEDRKDTPTTVDVEINDVEMTQGQPMKVTLVRPSSRTVMVNAAPQQAPVVAPKVEMKAKQFVKISGPFGKIKVSFNEVCVSDLALVLIQSGDADYELPTLEDGTELGIEVGDHSYKCLPGITFNRTSTGETHTVMLVSEKVK